MANSHNSPRVRFVHELTEFSTMYIIFSILFTLALTVFSYKEIFELRFMSQFASGTDGYSANVNQLLLDGYKNNLLDRFFHNLPLFGLVGLIILVSYSLVTTYRGTFHDLKVSKHYVNAKRDTTSYITLKHIALCSAAFAIPLLYWCYLLAVWFPFLIKYPLRYITGQNITPLVLTVIGVIFLLSLLVHIGLIISRVAIKVLEEVRIG